MIFFQLKLFFFAKFVVFYLLILCFMYRSNQKDECWEIMLIHSLFLQSYQKFSFTTCKVISSEVILKMKASELMGCERAFQAFDSIDYPRLSKITNQLLSQNNTEMVDFAIGSSWMLICLQYGYRPSSYINSYKWISCILRVRVLIIYS